MSTVAFPKTLAQLQAQFEAHNRSRDFFDLLLSVVLNDYTGVDYSDSNADSAHVLNFSGVTLAANGNVIRGIGITPKRASGWISFTGNLGATPAQCYTDYREMHATSTGEVLGIGSFPFMDSGASCASMFASQFITEVDVGATVLTAGGAKGVGIFPLTAKVAILGATFNSGGVAAAGFLSFQANDTDVSAQDTSILNMEVASGGIGSIFRIQHSAAKMARALFWFDATTIAPIIQTTSLFHDPNAVTCEKGLHVRIGDVSYMIPLYVSDSGAVVADW